MGSYADISVNNLRSAPSVNGPTNEDPELYIEQGIAQINQNVNKIKSLQKKSKARRQLLRLIDETKRIAQETDQQLRITSSFTEGYQTEDRARRQRRNRLANAFSNALRTFKQVSAESAKQEKSIIEQAKRETLSQKSEPISDDGEPDEHESLLQHAEEESRARFQAEVEYNEALILEREKGILDIENTLAEVNEIFTHIASIVQDQGEQIVTIETMTDNAKEVTGEAVTELEKAKKLEKKSRKKICIIVAVVVVVAAVVAVLGGILGGR